MLILFLPYGQNLVHVDLAVVVLQDLGDCADRVLCRVDVLRLPALGLGDNLQMQRKVEVKMVLRNTNAFSLKIMEFF